MEIKGKYTSAKIFTDNIEQEALSQIYEIMNLPIFSGSFIRIMPDVHAGKGCVIGFTCDGYSGIIPNIVGVDIGCGMYVINLGKVNINLEYFDDVVRCNIPAGREIHGKQVVSFNINDDTFYCNTFLGSKDYFLKSLGSLGGGNHFIELNKDSQDNIYLVIHSGSRNLGKQVCDIYQDLAIKQRKGTDENSIKLLIQQAKQDGKEKEIQELLKKRKESINNIPDSLCWLDLSGNLMGQYLDDMDICQKYAKTNREGIAQIILKNFSELKVLNSFHTVHNFIDNDIIIRKGAVSARLNELLLIPMNMRDGSLLCIGKGNEDWNYSAPHGAGRIMSRGKAKATLLLKTYKEMMEKSGVFTTSVNQNTIDESPDVYKNKDEILRNIINTVDIIDTLIPIYNFKAGG